MLLTIFQALKFYGNITISGSKLSLILIFFLHPCHLHLNVNVNLMTYSLFFRGFQKKISVRAVTIYVYFSYFFGILYYGFNLGVSIALRTAVHRKLSEIT